MSSSLSGVVLIICLTLPMTASAKVEKYCDLCELLVDDAKQAIGKDVNVSEKSLVTTATSLCGKYFIGFEEVICRILCQVNAADLLKALQEGVSNHAICSKGGVCSDGFK